MYLDVYLNFLPVFLILHGTFTSCPHKDRFIGFTSCMHIACVGWTEQVTKILCKQDGTYFSTTAYIYKVKIIIIITVQYNIMQNLYLIQPCKVHTFRNTSSRMCVNRENDGCRVLCICTGWDRRDMEALSDGRKLSFEAQKFCREGKACRICE